MRARVISVLVTLIMMLFCLATGHADEGAIREKLSHPHRDGELIVKFRDGRVGTAGKTGFHERHGSRSLKKFRGVGLDHIRVRPGDDLATAMRDMEHDPDVAYVEPNYLVQALVTPNDPSFSSLWGMTRIAAPAAWDVTTGISGVVVAVIDTGVDATHPDLAANLWPGIGYNAITGTNNPVDDHGHGTHVAGTIGAVGNNTLGVTGVNWNIRIVSCKFMDSSGSGTIADAIACLGYVRGLKDSGVNIVATNNSWGGSGYSQALFDAIAAQRDILFMAAAGNSGTNNDVKPTYPANYDHPLVLSIAATTSSDGLASFSEYGRRTVHVGAPGYSILSTTKGGGYGYMSGTSMASPHVTGLAGLISAGRPALDWKGIRNTILATGDPLADLAGKSITGRRINAYGALTCTASRLFSALAFPQSPVVGVPATLSALSISCADPVGPVTVGLSGGEVVNLSDDGVAPDLAAGDGIFTGTYTPTRTTETFAFSSPAGSETVTAPLAPPLLINAATLVNGMVGASYTATITASGGAPPYTWSLFMSTLTQGLTLNAGTGVISGTPTVAETRYFSAKVTDSLGITDVRTFSIAVKPVLTITTISPLPDALVGSAYNLELTASGGTLPYRWDLTSGTFPPGMTWGFTGIISGIPTTVGTYNFSMTLRDGLNATAVKSFTLTVLGTNQPPTVTLTAPANGATYTLPATITLTASASDPDGTISKVEFYNGATLLGTATTAPYSYMWTGMAAGTYFLTAMAYDNLGTTTSSAPVTVTVNGASPINVALQANGGAATASTYSAAYPAAAVNNGDRKGLNWGAGGVWRDGNYNVWPDWVQVTFNGQKTITEVDVFTVQDNLTNPVEPFGGMTFSLYGITAFDIQYWTGAAWVTVPGGSITGNNLVWRTVTFPAITTDRIRVLVNASLGNNSRIAEIEAYTAGGSPINQPPTVTLTAPVNSATFNAPAAISLAATASDPDGTISKVEFYNGATLLGTAATAPYGYTWTGVAAGAYTLTANAYDNLGATTTSAAVTVTVTNPNQPPTVTLTAPVNGATFTAPATISLTATASDPDGTVSKVEFYSGATLLGTAATAPYGYTWTGVAAGAYTLTAKAYDNLGATKTSAAVSVTVTPAVTRTNVALKTNGGVATASSYGILPPQAANDGDRKGITTSGATWLWRDANYNVWPDWLQITFNGQKTISEIDIYTAQTNMTSPVEPYAGLTFTSNGITAFDVQYWDGAIWVMVPGGSITGNNLVWMTISFPAVTTDRIRVVVTASLNNNSRITEIEAYTDSGGTVNQPPVVTLTAPATGSTYTAPATIDLAATASDPDGTISKVEFYNGVTLLGTATAAPYGYTWTGVPAGTFSLTARAYDDLGATTTSTAATVTVNEPVNQPPGVTLTAPATGSTFAAPATIDLAATASDPDGTISKVEFFNGVTLLGTATTAPYGYTWNSVPAGTYTLTARAYDNLGATTTTAAVTVTVTGVTRNNVALATNGGVATTSSYGSLPPQAVIDGDRKGLNSLGAVWMWRDATYNVWPDWVQIKFNGQKTISEIDVFTAQTSMTSPVEPSPGQTFTANGITAFDVQYWDGIGWVSVPGGSITGNNLVWRSITFPAVTTDRIRVVVNASLNNNSRITEIEAY